MRTMMKYKVKMIDGSTYYLYRRSRVDHDDSRYLQAYKEPVWESGHANAYPVMLLKNDLIVTIEEIV